MKFTYGFTFEGINYGWRDSDNKLFKLPQTINNRYYGLNELLLTRGRYSVSQKRKSEKQLINLKKKINFIL